MRIEWTFYFTRSPAKGKGTGKGMSKGAKRRCKGVCGPD